MLELINVKKTYVTKAGQTVALNGVNVVFPDKGMVFITGKSGSGKTTMLNVIGGLDGVDEGEIIIDGKKFSEFTPADYDSYRNTFVGFIFQEYNLLPEYTVEKNIRIADELQGRKTSLVHLNEMLHAVEIDGYNDRKPTQLSGGQRQRVSVTRAVIKNPKIIMADEPTGALDSASGIQVMELLKKLSKEKLVIVVSHEMEFAEKYADRILKVVDGNVVEDITLTDVEMTGSVYDGEEEVSVKLGGELSASETEVLVRAIKNKKKIQVSEKISVRQKQATGNIQSVHPDVPPALIKSKMKFSSVAGLGLKSLFVKPVRLFLTILLSVVAFAVFGLFDAVASFQDDRALTALLRDGDYTAVSAYATYSSDAYTKANIKLNQSQIDKINKETGYKFRGVYDINDDELVDNNGARNNFNRGYTLAEPQVDGFMSYTGKDYYLRTLNGIIEFSPDEIVGDVVDPKGFDYTILYGSYPMVTEMNPDPFNQVAISSYFAESILHWMNVKQVSQFGGKTVLSIEDLIGAKLSFANYYINGGEFVICGILDCGDIPSRYKILQEKRGGEEHMLAQDFSTYLYAGGYLNLFAADGYVEHVRAERKIKTTYVANYTDMEYVTTVGGWVNRSSFRFYNVDEFDNTNTIFFDDLYEAEGRTPVLADNEMLIQIRDLVEFVFEDERNLLPSEEKRTEYYSHMLVLQNDSYSYQERKESLKKVYEMTLELYEGFPAAFEENFKANITGHEVGATRQNEDFKIVGVYMYVGSYYRYDNTYKPFVLSEGGFDRMEITKEQGVYSRITSPLFNNYFGAGKLGKMMTKKSGLTLHWFNNSVLETIELNEEFIDQFANLFLYVSLALAVFSVFMLFNYISTSIISKRRSIGVLRGLGASGKNIFCMFLVESLVIALFNGVLASIVAAIACTFVNAYIIEVMSLGMSFALFGIRQISIILSASILTGVASSLFPIVRIAKEKPVELIRKE